MKKSIYLLFLFSFLGYSFEKESKIYIAGHSGLVGSAIIKELRALGYKNLITCSSQDLDLRRQEDTEKFFAQEKPEYVILAAAKVGGIKANMISPASFIYDNLAIELNVMHAAFKYEVKKLLFLGSSCIYPRHSLQPMEESYLLTGLPEPTNEFYALAKIAGIKLGQAYNKQYPHKTKFISCIPCNIYGPGDNWNLETSHVIPALITKIYQAQQQNLPFVTLLGNGNARREFLHVTDLAKACILLMDKYNEDAPINIGFGEDVLIKDLACKIKELVGFKGDIVYDQSFSDGMPQKLINSSKIRLLGWAPQVSLPDGLKDLITDYQLNN